MNTTGSRTWLPDYTGVRVTRRYLLRGAAAGAGAGLLAACGGNESTTVPTGGVYEPGTVWFAKDNYKLPDETKQAVRGGIYRGWGEGLEGHLDPITQSPSAAGAQHTHELLMFKARGPGIDPKALENRQPVGALAESWEFSSDGTTVTFTMRPNVQWHNVAPVNGRVMDIEDWKTSFERHIATGEFRAMMGGVVDKAEFPDSRRMVWKLKYPYAPIADQIYADRWAYVQVPKELNANPRLAEQTSIGTGYKILDKNLPSQTVEYRKNAEYWGGDPFIDRWHVPDIPEYSNRYAQFVSGNIMDFRPSTKDLLGLHRDAPGAVIVANPIPDNNTSLHRMGNITRDNKDPWDDVRVRVAILRSIDHKNIGAFRSNKQELEANGIPVELSPMGHLPSDPAYFLNPELGEMGPKLSPYYLYDPGEARKLVNAAGYSELPLELPFFTFVETGIIAELHQLTMDSIDRAGIFKLKIHYSQNDAEHRLYRNEGKFDGVLEERGASVGEADRFIFRNFHSAGNLPRGEQAYPDPRIDALAEAQRKEMEYPKRMQLLKDFQLLATELMPAIPGSHYFTTFDFRWPWLHNSAYGGALTPGLNSPPEGRATPGGHLHWLDPEMPNRDRG